MRVLAALPNYSKYCLEAKKYLEQNGCEVIENETGGPLNFEQLKEYVGTIDAAIAGVEVWNAPVFDLAPNLKIVARFGVGVDNFDLKEAKKRGIVCTNCPGLNAVSVAEHTIMLILNMLREGPQLNEETHHGKWRRLMVTELQGKTIGLLGFGAVAKNVAVRARAFGCETIAYDKYPNEEAAKAMGVTMHSLETVLKKSDIISVHVPALPETYHMINEETLKICKKSAYLVNTSRGTNVDEKAVYKALQSGELRGYASDVFEIEPVPKDYPLFQCSNYICTPHTAAESYENYHNTGMKTAEAIINVLKGTGEPWNRLV